MMSHELMLFTALPGDGCQSCKGLNISYCTISVAFALRKNDLNDSFSAALASEV